MTFGYDDISAQYRMESRSSVLQPLPRDFYRQSREYIETLHEEVRAHMLSGEDVADYEDLKDLWRSAQQAYRGVMEIRIQKICTMAIIGSFGGSSDLSELSPEERDYYWANVALGSELLSNLDRP